MRALPITLLLIFAGPALAQNNQSVWPSPQTKPNSLTIGPVPKPSPTDPKLEAQKKARVYERVIDQLKVCIKDGVGDRKWMSVAVDLAYNRDGTPAKEPILVDRLPSDPEAAKTITLMVGALRRCQLHLPEDTYDIWKVLPLQLQNDLD